MSYGVASVCVLDIVRRFDKLRTRNVGETWSSGSDSRGRRGMRPRLQMAREVSASLTLAGAKLAIPPTNPRLGNWVGLDSTAAGKITI